MATATLLKANPLKLKQRFPNQLPSIRHRRNFVCFIKQPNLNAKYRVSSSTTTKNGVVKCFLMKQKQPSSSHEFTENSPNPLEVIADAVMNALKSLRKPAIAAVLIGVLLMCNPYKLAMAASGGRMGGRSFSSRSSSRSYSTRSTGSRFTNSVPYYRGGGGGGGGGFFYWLYTCLLVMYVVSFSVLAVMYIYLFCVSIYEAVVLTATEKTTVLKLHTATEKTTVLKLQVGLMGLGRTLQSNLNGIADVADTSTPEGLSYVLRETTLALLRHPDYCISGCSSVDVMPSLEDGEKRFDQLSIEERGKFDEETLVNVDNIKRQSTSSQRASGFSNEYLVVGLGCGCPQHRIEGVHELPSMYYLLVITILVAAEGVHELPNINGSGDLKEALQKLESIPSSRTKAVEVLWTPQNENDILSEQELLKDYPLLKPL